MRTALRFGVRSHGRNRRSDAYDCGGVTQKYGSRCAEPTAPRANTTFNNAAVIIGQRCSPSESAEARLATIFTTTDLIQNY
ncbi:MAG: hypothetical protein WBD48_19480 [Pseudolabrys sp.]